MASGLIYTTEAIFKGFHGGWGGRSGTVGGRYPGCFSWVLRKRSLPKPDQRI